MSQEGSPQERRGTPASVPPLQVTDNWSVLEGTVFPLHCLFLEDRLPPKLRRGLAALSPDLRTTLANRHKWKQRRKSLEEGAESRNGNQAVTPLLRSEKRRMHLARGEGQHPLRASPLPVPCSGGENPRFDPSLQLLSPNDRGDRGAWQLLAMTRADVEAVPEVPVSAGTAGSGVSSIFRLQAP